MRRTIGEKRSRIAARSVPMILAVLLLPGCLSHYQIDRIVTDHLEMQDSNRPNSPSSVGLPVYPGGAGFWEQNVQRHSSVHHVGGTKSSVATGNKVASPSATNHTRKTPRPVGWKLDHGFLYSVEGASSAQVYDFYMRELTRTGWKVQVTAIRDSAGKRVLGSVLWATLAPLRGRPVRTVHIMANPIDPDTPNSTTVHLTTFSSR